MQTAYTKYVVTLMWSFVAMAKEKLYTEQLYIQKRETISNLDFMYYIFSNNII